MAEASDAAEDKLYGADKTGEEMPDWVADKRRRAERIRKAKAELEAEAKAAAEAKLKAAAEAQQQREAEGRKKPGRQAAPPSTTPDPKAQKNFTDPESRIMKSKDGFVQAYNAQIAVDSRAQIIVAQDVTQSAVDSGQLVPMIDATKANLGRYPAQASADAGYCSEGNLEALESRDIDGYVATGRARDAVAGDIKGEAAAALGAPELGSASKPEAGPKEIAVPKEIAAAKEIVEPNPEAASKPTRVEAMRAKIKAGGHTSPYRLRKQLPEPVFGQIKQARGFRQFLLRGFDNVRAEWAIICTAHNLIKLAQRWTLSATLPQAS